MLLSSSAPSVLAVPSSVRITANKTTVGFTATTTAVTAPTAVIVNARFGGVIQRERVIVAPENTVTLSTFGVTPDRVVSEGATTGIVTLTAAAPYGGADVTIEPNRRNIVTVPSIVTIPEGATSATFAITADRLNASKERSVAIIATYNGVSGAATVTVLPKPTASATPQPVALCASLALAPCLTTNALSIAAHATQDPAPPSSGERQYFLYTPELNLLAETTSSTAIAPPIAYEYIWFAGEPLAQVNITTGEIHYYFTDHLGTPILQTDESARVVWQAEYEPYGGIHALRRGEAKHQSLRLPGQEANGPADTAYNIYRWYRNEWGRYSQSDPIGLAGGFNLYGYAAGNPVMRIDPLGKLSYNVASPTYTGGTWDQTVMNCDGQAAYGCVKLKGRIDCNCKCSNGAWRALVTITVKSHSVYYATDAPVPGSLILAEEQKHVDENIVRLNTIRSEGLKIEAKSYPLKIICQAECKVYELWGTTMMYLSGFYTHVTDPHPY